MSPYTRYKVAAKDDKINFLNDSFIDENVQWLNQQVGGADEYMRRLLDESAENRNATGLLEVCTVCGCVNTDRRECQDCGSLGRISAHELYVAYGWWLYSRNRG